MASIIKDSVGLSIKLEPGAVRGIVREVIAQIAEPLGFVVIDRADLEAHYAELRELRAVSKYATASAAAETFAFVALGEPGTEDN